ncbi:MAG: hypothetical protein EBR82_02860 [Caulobacteraceae bacterium]|nr:hypothetical protein [Caulobacteraceae bacterium]
MPAPAREARLAEFSGVIVRRYCDCGALNRCVCGLPRADSGWTVDRLQRLRILRLEGHSVSECAFQLGQDAQQTNIAINAMLGRTPAHALAVLERQARHGVPVTRFDDGVGDGW